MPLPDLPLSLDRASASALALPAAGAVGAIALYSTYSASIVRTPLDDTRGPDPAAKSPSSSVPSSGTLPMLWTLADLRSALAPTEAALTVEALLAVDSRRRARWTSEAALRRRVLNSVPWPPEVIERAENAAESVRAWAAGELCAFEYADAASDALTGSRSTRSSAARARPPSAGARSRPACARRKPASVDPYATDASEDTDKLADGSVKRGARCG
jgi:hypothetical protein